MRGVGVANEVKASFEEQGYDLRGCLLYQVFVDLSLSGDLLGTCKGKAGALMPSMAVVV